MTVQELAALVGGRFALPEDATKRITGAASVSEAGEGHVTFYANPRYLNALRACRATAALVPPDFSEQIGPVPILVENPSGAFSQLVQQFAPEPLCFAPGVHPTAVIAADVQLGDGVSVQPYAVIEAGAKIGANSIIGAHCYVGHEAQIGAGCQLAARVTVGHRCIVGNRVILHSGVVLGSDGFGFELVNGRHVKIPQTGIVQIDDDVEIGANSAVDRARFGRTWIGEGTKIDNLVQIGHNVVVGKHCILCGQVGIAGSTTLGNYVTFAGQAACTGHIHIGDQAVIAGQSGASKDIAPKEVILGSPGIPLKEAKEQRAYLRRLPKLYERVRQLEKGAESSQPSGKYEPGASERL